MRYGAREPYVIKGREIVPPRWRCWVELTMREALEEMPELRPWWDYFCEVLPDHPDEGNTVLLFVSETWMSDVDLYLVCTHFEEHSADEVVHLVSLLYKLADIFGARREGFVPFIDILDGYAELLVCSIPGINVTKMPPSAAKLLVKAVEELKKAQAEAGE